MRIVVTGGAGFVGGHLIQRLLDDGHPVLNIDNLTYAAGDPHTHSTNKNYRFVEADINEVRLVTGLFNEFRPTRIIHLAAESHVDRSIANSHPFIHTNIVGTYQLLEATRAYFQSQQPANFRLMHFSTDEVFGSLAKDAEAVGPDGVYRPSSPYSASKAAADHLVHAWKTTHGIPTQLIRSTNIFGPGQHEEKLIPTVIRKALAGQPIPIYGDGQNRRDWLHVSDCVEVLTRIGAVDSDETRNIAGRFEISNRELATRLCEIMESLFPSAENESLSAEKSYRDLIELTEDRPGHDFRYALDDDATRIAFDWEPKLSNTDGLRSTLTHYLQQHPSTRNKAPR